MTDVKDGLKFFECGGGLLFNLGLKFLGIQCAPFSPTCFRGERARFGSGQIAVNRAPPQLKPPGRLDFGTPRLQTLDHPLPQVQRIGFHTPKPITLCANVNVNHYITARPSSAPCAPIPRARPAGSWAGPRPITPKRCSRL
jgi:hypothetical protein